jgi:transposase
MPATHGFDSTFAPVPTLYLAFDLGWSSWNLASTVAMTQKPRLKTIRARDLDALRDEIARAKARFGLPADARVVSCYEAGRDGFWIHRFLQSQHVDNIVVDAASIEVNRRARRAKSDSLDAGKLLTMLMRYHNGEKKLWSVVNVPSPEDDDRRQPHRELSALKTERTEHSNRIKGLLAGLGLDVDVDGKLVERLAALRLWDGSMLPTNIHQRILREFERWKLVDRQVHDLDNAQRRAIRDDATVDVEKVRRLMDLKAIGPVSATLFVREFFGWRKIKNRRELASLAGLCPTPYNSGESRREQGISKAGNRRLRAMAVEIAWMWLRYQPRSALSCWYEQRFASGNARSRKVGIVALARKLLVALWKYLDRGEVPEGAEFTPWEKKLNGRMPAGAA